MKYRFCIFFVKKLKQEPTLFIGTIRSNLDPFNQYSDQSLWESLEKVWINEQLNMNFKFWNVILQTFRTVQHTWTFLDVSERSAFWSYKYLKRSWNGWERWTVVTLNAKELSCSRFKIERSTVCSFR